MISKWFVKLSEKGKLIAYYDWTSFWSYVYSAEGKPLGKLKCLAFRGICAAGAASFLSRLFLIPGEDKLYNTLAQFRFDK